MEDVQGSEERDGKAVECDPRVRQHGVPREEPVALGVSVPPGMLPGPEPPVKRRLVLRSEAELQPRSERVEVPR